MKYKNISIVLIVMVLSLSVFSCVYGANFSIPSIQVEDNIVTVTFMVTNAGERQLSSIIGVDKTALVNGSIPEDIDESKIMYMDEKMVNNGENSFVFPMPDGQKNSEFRIFISGDNGATYKFADFTYQAENTPSPSASPSISPSTSPSAGASASPDASASPSISPSPSATPSYGGGGGGGGGSISSPSPSPSPSPSIVPTVSPEVSPSPEQTPNIVDISGHWAEQQITDLIKRGIVKGVTEDEFMPGKEITRAEFASLIRRSLDLPLVTYENQYGDINSGDWYADEIQSIINTGIMEGSDGFFRPDKLITREEMAKVIVGAYQIITGKTAPNPINISFSDFNEISPWALSYIKQVVSLGLMNGMDEITFAPKLYSTRAQAAVVIYRLLNI